MVAVYSGVSACSWEIYSTSKPRPGSLNQDIYWVIRALIITMDVVVLVLHRVEVLVTVLVDDLLSQKELG